MNRPAHFCKRANRPSLFEFPGEANDLQPLQDDLHPLGQSNCGDDSLAKGFFKSLFDLAVRSKRQGSNQCRIASGFIVEEANNIEGLTFNHPRVPLVVQEVPDFHSDTI